MIYRYLILCCCVLTQKAVGQSIDSIINEASLRQVIEVLASDSLEGRFTGTVHAQMAATFIAEEFKKAGALPIAGNTGYFMPFKASGASSDLGINVMAIVKGKSKPDELIIFCAHYDHVGTHITNPFKFYTNNRTNRKKDVIFNGANDNASGVSAVIHLARYFGQLNNERSVLFITFSGEELGLQGSQQAVLLFKPEYVKAVINIEMIGRPISKKNRNPFITGSNLSDLQQVLNNRLLETDPKLYGKKFFTDDPFYDAGLFARSDNYWFAQKGIPAHTIMASSPNDDYYHSPGDELSTLDLTLMSTIVKAIALSSAQLIQGTSTPTRINPRKIDARF